jgi:sedoheptulokinase
MNAAAENAEMSDLRFDPIFGGSRWREPSARATLSGLTPDNFEFGAVTRALLAGMIEEIAAPYFEMEAHLRHKGLRGSGNGMRRNPALRKIAEKRVGLPLVLSESEEEAARGAALLTLS